MTQFRIRNFFNSDSFATSPENAFSIIILTLLVNVLATQGGLDIKYLFYPYAFIGLYLAALSRYGSIHGKELIANRLEKFNRHVFHAGLWSGLAVPLLWVDFLYPHFYFDQVLSAYFLPILGIKQIGTGLSVFCLFFMIAFKKRTKLKVSFLDEIKRLTNDSISVFFLLAATAPFAVYTIDRLLKFAFVPFVYWLLGYAIFYVLVANLNCERLFSHL